MCDRVAIPILTNVFDIRRFISSLHDKMGVSSPLGDEFVTLFARTQLKRRVSGFIDPNVEHLYEKDLLVFLTHDIRSVCRTIRSLECDPDVTIRTLAKQARAIHVVQPLFEHQILIPKPQKCYNEFTEQERLSHQEAAWQECGE